MMKRRVVYAKLAVLSSPINKLLDLRKCVDCLRNYTRMYGRYLTQCFIQGIVAVGYSPPYIYIYIYIYILYTLADMYLYIYTPVLAIANYYSNHSSIIMYIHVIQLFCCFKSA